MLLLLEASGFNAVSSSKKQLQELLQSDYAQLNENFRKGIKLSNEFELQLLTATHPQKDVQIFLPRGKLVIQSWKQITPHHEVQYIRVKDQKNHTIPLSHFARNQIIRFVKDLSYLPE